MQQNLPCRVTSVRERCNRPAIDTAGFVTLSPRVLRAQMGGAQCVVWRLIGIAQGDGQSASNGYTSAVRDSWKSCRERAEAAARRVLQLCQFAVGAPWGVPWGVRRLALRVRRLALRVSHPERSTPPSSVSSAHSALLTLGISVRSSAHREMQGGMRLLLCS